MTHRQGWTYISQAFEKPEPERDWREWDLTSLGLCHAAMIVFGWPRDKMRKLEKFGEPCDDQGFWFPPRYHANRTTRAHPRQRLFDKYRATIAAFFAAMTEKEFREIVLGE